MGLGLKGGSLASLIAGRAGGGGGGCGGGGGNVDGSTEERAASLASIAGGGGGIAGGVLLVLCLSLSFPADALMDATELVMMDEVEAVGVFFLSGFGFN